MNCPFCHIGPDRNIIHENDWCTAIYDIYPVSPGHALIIPKIHCSNYFDLNAAEQHACWETVNTVKEIISNHYQPDGFNIGINIGESAGQTIGHVHIHLIPRYKGDMENPRGGVRGVIPERQKY